MSLKDDRLTPRKRGLQPLPDQVRASLRLDRDPVKFIAAQRTPRRIDKKLEEMSMEEKERLRDLEMRRKRLARVQEVSGSVPTIDEITEDAELEAVLHLPEHHYDRQALARFQHANDVVLVEADRALCRIDGSGGRSSFMMDHYKKKSGSTSPNSSRHVLPKLQLKNAAVSFAPKGSARGEELKDTSPEHHGSARSPASSRVAHPSQQEKDRAGNRRGSAFAGTAIVPEEQALQWLRDHDDEPPHHWRRYEELRSQKEFCMMTANDLFSAARDHFVCQEPSDPFHGAPSHVSTVASSFHKNAQPNSDGILATILAAGDYVFGADPRFVDVLTIDFVREMMETLGIEVVFLSDDELPLSLGVTQYEAWLAAATELVEERKKKAASRGDQPSEGPVIDVNQVLDDGPNTFVIRRSTQSNAAEMRKLEKKMTAMIAAVFDAQMQALKEEAVSSILLADAPDV